MSTTSGTMRNLKVTDKDGNIFNMAPVDSEARQAIDEAKNLQFDEDYFTSELSQDESELSIGLNGVPIGVESPLKFIQDDDQGIVIGSDALTQSSADTLYYPLSNNPSGYLTEITGDFSGNNVSATSIQLYNKITEGGYNYTSSVNIKQDSINITYTTPGANSNSNLYYNKLTFGEVTNGTEYALNTLKFNNTTATLTISITGISQEINVGGGTSSRSISWEDLIDKVNNLP
jgi:hypothetical protein